MSDLDRLWAALKPDTAGLVAAVIVHASDGRVLMLGYMNREALGATIDSNKVTFYSRSRQCLWQKGESSGNVLALRSLRVDCDGDALLVEAEPAGPTCHTGASSCFYKPLEGAAFATEDDGPAAPAPNHPTGDAIDLVWQTILDRKAGRGMTNRQGKSYVRSLLDKGVAKINSKIDEEADELATALAEESDERVINEAADLLFHALVGLAARDLDPAAVAEVLRQRHGLSGIDEKAAR